MTENESEMRRGAAIAAPRTNEESVTENVTEVITPAYTEEKLTKPAGYYPINYPITK